MYIWEAENCICSIALTCLVNIFCLHVHVGVSLSYIMCKCVAVKVFIVKHEFTLWFQRRLTEINKSVKTLKYENFRCIIFAVH